MSSPQISSVSGIYNAQAQFSTIMTFTGMVTALSALCMDTSVLSYLTTIFGFLSGLLHVSVSLNRRYPPVSHLDLVNIFNDMAFGATFFTFATYLMFALQLVVVGIYYHGFIVCTLVFVLTGVILRKIPPKIKLFLTEQ